MRDYDAEGKTPTCQEVALDAHPLAAKIVETVAATSKATSAPTATHDPLSDPLGASDPLGVTAVAAHSDPLSGK